MAIWIGINHFPHIAFDAGLTILQLLLLTEGCCIGSVVLMSQHRQSSLDRRIALSDYIVDCQMRSDLKELKPLIHALHNDMRDKKNNKFWCDECGEPRYKCCCEVEKRLHTS